ncbi:hypothetical protein MY8738_008485 [Beauveria namnaoensis]
MATNGDDEDDDNIVRIKPWEPNAFTLIEMPGVIDEADLVVYPS